MPTTGSGKMAITVCYLAMHLYYLSRTITIGQIMDHILNTIISYTNGINIWYGDIKTGVPIDLLIKEFLGSKVIFRHGLAIGCSLGNGQ